MCVSLLRIIACTIPAPISPPGAESPHLPRQACAAGVLSTQVIIALTDWNALISPSHVGQSPVNSLSVGVLFGIFPARRAACMDPIAVLRHE